MGLPRPMAMATAGFTRLLSAMSPMPTAAMATPRMTTPRHIQIEVAGSWPADATITAWLVATATGPYGAGEARQVGSAMVTSRCDRCPTGPMELGSTPRLAISPWAA